MDRLPKSVEYKSVTLPVVKIAEARLVPPEYPDLAFVRNQMLLSMETRILRDNAGGPITRTDTKTYTVIEPNFPRWIPKWLQRHWSQEVTKNVTASLTVQPSWVYPDYYPSNQLGQAVRYIDDQPIRWNDE